MLDLYKNIKMRRRELGMTQEELAKKTGYTNKSSIATIEAGKIDLPQSKIMEFAEALETTPLVLMGWDDLEDEDIPDIVPGTGELLDLYSRATPEQRQAVINLLRSFVS